MADIRRAEERDLPGIRKLLFQVNQLHADGRPDLFKGPATKYSAEDEKYGGIIRYARG